MQEEDKNKDKNIVKDHEQKHTIIEYIEYPSHQERSTSEEFKKNHEQLVKIEKHNCFVCELLDLPKSSEEHLEVHHAITEWAEWENVDPIKIQRLFDEGVFDFYGYSKKLKGQKVKSPDDIRNLLVLCMLHHRGKGVGIHNTSAPVWFSQMVAKDGEEILKGALER